MKYLIITTTIAMLWLGIQTVSAQTARDFARMAKAKMDLGDFKGAIEDFSSVIRLQPEYEALYQAHFGRGYAKFQSGDFKGAKTDFDRAIRIYPNDPEVFVWRAYAKYRLKYSASSEIADLNRAILLNPDYAEAYFNRGQAKINNRQLSSGCRDLRKALELGFPGADTQVRIHCGE